MPGELIRDEFEYTWIEDPKTLTVAKHKRPKIQPPPPKKEGGLDLDAPIFTIKDALEYTETVHYYQNFGDYKPQPDDTIIHVLADLKDILPLGYPTE